MGGGDSFRGLVIFSLIACAAALSLQFTPRAFAQAGNADVTLSWSHPATSKTILKNREFHGPFGHEDLTVTCDGLGKHDFLDISFDLLIMSSWDGSDLPLPDGSLEAVGPDYFRLGIQNGPTLLYHTFSNIPLTDPPGGFRFTHETSKAQNYPSQVAGVRLAPHSGASEYNSLGYEYTDTAPHPIVPMDATYPIHFIIPHSDAKAVLEFNGLHLQDPFDENWGVANLVVRTLGAQQVTKPNTDAIATAFQNSLGARPDLYIQAFQTLISGMDDTADWIEKNVNPVPLDPDAQIWAKRLVAGGADEARAAVLNLRQMGPLVEPYLRDARKTAQGDARAEIDTALETLGVLPIGNQNIRRVILATRALEVIGTPHALSVRNDLTTKAAPTAGDNRAAAVAGPTSKPWDMHFGENTVSLVAIGPFTNDPASATWWTPDGMPTTAPPVVINVGRGASVGGRYRQLALAYHVTGPSIQDPRIFPSVTMGTSGTSSTLEGAKDGYFLFSIYDSLGPTVNILTRFGNGPPVKKAIYDFDPATMTTKQVVGDPDFSIFSARQFNPNAFGVEFTQQESTSTLDWDVVLIRKDDQRVIHQSQNGQGRGMLYDYVIGADQIKQITYESRPWESLELQSVSLMSGVQTELIVVKPPPEPAMPKGFRISN